MMSFAVLHLIAALARKPGSSTRQPGRFRRRVAWSVGLAAAAVVVSAPFASAAVDITPAQGVQGDAASVTFEIQNLRPKAYTTKVEVDLPPDQPVAEVFPMTHPDWAPQIVSHPVAQALVGIHGGQLSDVTSAIIWTRADDAPPAPAVESLRLELGPLPAVNSFVFSVVQTYSDGTVQRWQGPGTVLALVPPVGPPSLHSHGAGPSLQDTVAPVADASQVPEDPFSPLSLVAVFIAIGAIVVAVEAAGGRRLSRVPFRPARPTTTQAPDGTLQVEPAAAEPVAVGAGGAGEVLRSGS
jgi:hypothetical protein